MLVIKGNISDQLDTIRSLFTEFAEWMNYECCFDSFESELADLPGDCRPPNGFILLATFEDEPAGCVALQRIDKRTCEMKRLWVKNDFRQQKIGSSLVKEVVTRAKEIGYRKVRLETTEKMANAIKLYKLFGFKVTSEQNNMIRMELELSHRNNHK